MDINTCITLGSLNLITQDFGGAVQLLRMSAVSATTVPWVLEQVCVAVCCGVLQCVAVCCSVLQCVVVCCSVLQRCRVLQGVNECCSAVRD